MRRRHPALHFAYHVSLERRSVDPLKIDNSVQTPVEVSGYMVHVPARPEGFASFVHRLRMALLVFTGRADVLYWPHQEG